jgi:hypothetical protein
MQGSQLSRRQYTQKFSIPAIRLAQLLGIMKRRADGVPMAMGNNW